MVALLLLTLGATAPRLAFADPYVALGTSIGAGWEASGRTWFPNPDNSGYVNLLFSDLQADLGADQLWNYSEPGATAESILIGGDGILTSPQLPAALVDINDASDTKAVTVEVGANEYFSASYSVCNNNWDDPACPYRENVASILTQLNAALAADPGEESFSAMGHFNPDVGTAGEATHDLGLLGTNLAISCEDSGDEVGLNDVMYQEAAKLGVVIADPYPAFKAGGESFMADHAHPNDDGHQAMRQSFLDASAPCSGSGPIDNFAPDTAIDSGPSGATNDTDPSFSFSSSEAGSRFDCGLDDDGWFPCASPKTYSGLAGGHHTFKVRAVDRTGNVDAFPATRTFTVDTTPPDTTIDSGPTGTTNLSPSFGFSSSEPGSTFQCSLDSGAFATCSSPKSYASLSDGSHTFQVRTTDPAGNTDPSPASRTFTVDATPPDTTITSGPTGTTTNPSPSFGFSSSEPGSTFQCSLDSGAFATCSSPKSYASLSDGSHTFQMRATDPAGNTDPTPATRDFTVDATVYKAKIKKVKVKGSAKIKKGKKATYKAKITNSGNARATGVRLKVRGRGVKSKKSVGKIGAKKTRTVKIKLKPKKPGKVKVSFKVTSKNAGGKTAKKKIKVKR